MARFCVFYGGMKPPIEPKHPYLSLYPPVSPVLYRDQINPVGKRYCDDPDADDYNDGDGPWYAHIPYSEFEAFAARHNVPLDSISVTFREGSFVLDVYLEAWKDLTPEEYAAQEAAYQQAKAQYDREMADYKVAMKQYKEDLAKYKMQVLEGKLKQAKEKARTK